MVVLLMESGAGEECEQYKPNTVPEEHLTLSLWWFLTIAEQVSLFITEEIWTFSILYFLKHMKNPLIIFVLLQFEDEMSPTPSLLSSAPHFLWNCHFQGCSLVPDRLLPTQPSIQSKRLNEEGWGSEDDYSEPSQNTCFILCISFYFLKENCLLQGLWLGNSTSHLIWGQIWFEEGELVATKEKPTWEG